MPNYVPFYFKDLPVQIPLRDLRGIFSTLIPKLNRAKRKIEFSNTDFDQFFLKVEGATIDITSMCSKLLYSSFISLKRINTLYSNKWQTEFPNKILNWPLIWQNIHKNLFNFKIQSTLWQLIHRNYICAYFLKKIYNTDGICKLCKSFELQRTHVFLECEVIKFIYSYFDSILKNLNDKGI